MCDSTQRIDDIGAHACLLQLDDMSDATGLRATATGGSLGGEAACKVHVHYYYVHRCRIDDWVQCPGALFMTARVAFTTAEQTLPTRFDPAAAVLFLMANEVSGKVPREAIFLDGFPWPMGRLQRTVPEIP
nr:hypothetical protein CFP56_63054 [Quercus suber]